MRLSCRYRCLLPVGHTVLDLLLLTAWMWHAEVVLNSHGVAGSSFGAAYAQTDNVGWDPIYASPEPRFALMLTGTLPAGIISASVRPEAGWQTRHRLWDPVWLLVHEAVAIPLWFLVGTWLDGGRSRLRRTMVAYLVGRVVLAVASLAVPGANWWTLQFLFWLGLAGYGALQGVHWLLRRTRGALS